MTDQKISRSLDEWYSDVDTFLNALDKFPWFENVGKPLKTRDVKQVFSWDEAWESTQDNSWTYASFHKDIDQGHPVWAKAYDRALESVIKSGHNHELDPGVYVSLQAAWDAGGAAYQIAMGNKDGFYIKLMDWYRKGHWPCGWEGEYPKGLLIVY